MTPPEDHAAIQPALSQIQVYPLSQFDGKMKTMDWSKLPHPPMPKEKTPAQVFDQATALG